MNSAFFIWRSHFSHFKLRKMFWDNLLLKSFQFIHTNFSNELGEALKKQLFKVAYHEGVLGPRTLTIVNTYNTR